MEWIPGEFLLKGKFAFSMHKSDDNSYFRFWPLFNDYFSPRSRMFQCLYSSTYFSPEGNEEMHVMSIFKELKVDLVLPRPKPEFKILSCTDVDENGSQLWH